MRGGGGGGGGIGGLTFAHSCIHSRQKIRSQASGVPTSWWGRGEVLGVLPLPTPVYTLDRRYDHRPLGYQRPGGGGGIGGLTFAHSCIHSRQKI